MQVTIKRLEVEIEHKGFTHRFWRVTPEFEKLLCYTVIDFTGAKQVDTEISTARIDEVSKLIHNSKSPWCLPKALMGNDVLLPLLTAIKV